MRVLLDTNVLVAAFVARGTCAQLFEHVVRAHDLVTSPYILEELGRVLREKLGVPDEDSSAAVGVVRDAADVVDPEPLAGRVAPDPDDDPILAAAVSGRCDCLVTGDRALVDLRRHEEVAILRPGDFWSFELERGKR